MQIIVKNQQLPPHQFETRLAPVILLLIEQTGDLIRLTYILIKLPLECSVLAQVLLFDVI